MTPINISGLKYLDTSSVEFGRKLPSASDRVEVKVAPPPPPPPAPADASAASERLLLVEEEEGISRETSNVIKRNFASDQPTKSINNVLPSPVDSNSFRLETELPHEEGYLSFIRLRDIFVHFNVH